MKTLILSFLIFFLSFSCSAQSNWNAISDSIAIVSRAKANIVLMCFDSLKSPKLLYSVLDKDYYVLVKDQNKYKEYYIKVDSLGKIIELRTYKQNKRANKELSTLNPFELHYSSEFITSMPNAEYVRGYSTYFVIKTITGESLGEYCLSAFTLPPPIDSQLYGFLIRRLSEKAK